MYISEQFNYSCWKPHRGSLARCLIKTRTRKTVKGLVWFSRKNTGWQKRLIYYKGSGTCSNKSNPIPKKMHLRNALKLIWRKTAPCAVLNIRTAMLWLLSWEHKLTATGQEKKSIVIKWDVKWKANWEQKIVSVLRYAKEKFKGIFYSFIFLFLFFYRWWVVMKPVGNTKQAELVAVLVTFPSSLFDFVELRRVVMTGSCVSYVTLEEAWQEDNITSVICVHAYEVGGC